MQGIIGKKVGMTRMFDKETGKTVAVTVIQTGTNIVHQVKLQDKDGYSAAQLGYDPIAEEDLIKPKAGHFKKLGTTPTRVIKEFAISAGEEVKPGDKIGVEIFEGVKLIDVVGTSIGRGFAGTIKRYSFHRGRVTHGGKHVRERGSMGAGTFPARVFPGLRMAGHYGNHRVTVRNIEIVGLNKEDGLVYLKGAVPGKRNIVYLVKKS
jgi:large subunit ribosomal protein L3